MTRSAAGSAPDAGSNAASTLEIRGAALAYGARPALAGIDLALPAGQTLALLGPNGAGKTSLMRLAAGRLPPDRGTVRVCGGDPARAASVRRRIGFVPQEIGLYPRLTVAENLDVFAQLAGLGRSARRAAVAGLVERCGLAGVAGRIVATLSGGYRRRVHLAASLVTQPCLILLDEPSQGIDLEARAAIHAVLADLGARGAAILLSTHDFSEAERLADRVAVLAEGRIVREGALAELMRGYTQAPPEQEAVLDARPDPEAEAALRRAGLVPREAGGPQSLRWTGRPAGGLEGSALLAELRRRGVPAVEIRLRRPGLEALYRDSLAGAHPEKARARPEAVTP